MLQMEAKLPSNTAPNQEYVHLFEDYEKKTR